MDFSLLLFVVGLILTLTAVCAAVALLMVGRLDFPRQPLVPVRHLRGHRRHMA